MPVAACAITIALKNGGDVYGFLSPLFDLVIQETIGHEEDWPKSFQG
jgi:hypothetical protein